MNEDSMLNNLCHLEIETKDMATSRKFYQALFGWDFKAFFDGMEVFGLGDSHIGGLMLVDEVTPGKSPSLWFKVANIEEQIAVANANGGKMIEPKSEVPNVGWSAIIEDPFGTAVGIVQYQ